MQEVQPCCLYSPQKKKTYRSWKGGRILRILRHAPFPGMQRLSQKKLADLAQLPPKTIKDIETKGPRCHIEDYRNLLKATPISPSLQRQIIRALMLLNAPQRDLKPEDALKPFQRWMTQVPWPSMLVDSFGDVVMLNEGVLRIHGLEAYSAIASKKETSEDEKGDANLLWWLFSDAAGDLFHTLDTAPDMTLEKLVKAIGYWFLRASIGYVDECYWWYRYQQLRYTPNKQLRKPFEEGLKQAWEGLEWGDFNPLITFRHPDGQDFEAWMDMTRIVTPFGDLYWIKYLPTSREQSVFMEKSQHVYKKKLAPWPLSEKKIPEGWQPRTKYLRYLPAGCSKA